MKVRLETTPVHSSQMLDLLILNSIPSWCQRFVCFPKRQHDSRTHPAPDSLLFPWKKAVGAKATYFDVTTKVRYTSTSPCLHDVHKDKFTFNLYLPLRCHKNTSDSIVPLSHRFST
jgi:hypothetical protein